MFLGFVGASWLVWVLERRSRRQFLLQVTLAELPAAGILVVQMRCRWVMALWRGCRWCWLLGIHGGICIEANHPSLHTPPSQSQPHGPTVQLLQRDTPPSPAPLPLWRCIPFGALAASTAWATGQALLLLAAAGPVATAAVAALAVVLVAGVLHLA